LYAKTLALVGLGALAMVGALVDYWPTRVPMPAVSAAPLAGPDDGLQALPLGAFGHMPSARPQPTDVVRLAAVRTPVVTDTDTDTDTSLRTHASRAVLVSRVVDAVAIPAVRLNRPPADDDADGLALDTALDTDGVEVSIQPPDAFLASSHTSLAAVDTSDEGDPGMLTGAFKRTGTSIVRTGVRTGASIFDALRVVSGAVRRALPD
jgi:hypothetical protein